jgi:hypothetical protein
MAAPFPTRRAWDFQPIDSINEKKRLRRGGEARRWTRDGEPPDVKRFTHKVIHSRCGLFRDSLQMNGLQAVLAIYDELHCGPIR